MYSYVYWQGAVAEVKLVHKDSQGMHIKRMEWNALLSNKNKLQYETILHNKNKHRHKHTHTCRMQEEAQLAARQSKKRAIQNNARKQETRVTQRKTEGAREKESESENESQARTINGQAT